MSQTWYDLAELAVVTVAVVMGSYYFVSATIASVGPFGVFEWLRHKSKMFGCVVCLTFWVTTLWSIAAVVVVDSLSAQIGAMLWLISLGATLYLFKE